jgi:hypothetical protein
MKEILSSDTSDNPHLTPVEFYGSCYSREAIAKVRGGRKNYQLAIRDVILT